MQENLSKKDTSKPSLIPILLSAFVFPGLGQLLQRRWVPAVIFGISFTICFVIFNIYAIKIIVDLYTIGFEFDTYHDVSLPTFRATASFLAAILIYVISLFDTYRAYRRAYTKWASRDQG